MARIKSRRALLRAFRQAGGTARQAWDALNRSTRAAAKEQGWQLSELAVTLADASRDLEKVYGKRAATALFGKDR